MRLPRLNPVILFCFMIVYVVASYSWWTVLLLEKNQETFNERAAALTQRYAHAGYDATQALHSNEYQQLERRRDAQRKMVLGESAVFLLLILIIGMQSLRGFTKEIELNRSQKNFLLSITHELRSPIASAKLAMQTLERQTDLPPQTVARLLDNAVGDMDRLHSLVENLLLSAKIENDALDAGNEAVNFSELVAEATSQLDQPLAASHPVLQHIEPNLFTTGDRNALWSVVMNLIENAVKYSPAGSRIHVNLTADGDALMFEVADEGYGIPENERRKIFRKFYRIGNENTRRAKGTGLGLYIVERIVALHRGKIHVKPNQPRGTVFEVQLPLSRTL